MNPSTQRPLTLLICALGGEGGGVLAEWLVETATRCGYSAQSTSIPGVAQRTGSTTYYFEVFPVPLAELGGRRPVFSLYPVPGALDVLVSSELLETVRHIGNGMASAERTLVVTSSARTLTTAEKMQLADGRAPSAELLRTVEANSRIARIFDMAEVASGAGTVLSAVLFGAIAGSGVLPFARGAFEETIGKSGKGVEASLRGFARACEIVGMGLGAAGAPSSRASAGADLPPGIAGEFPAATHAMLAAGHARMLEYQDAAYARLYLQRLRQVLAAERASDPSAIREYATTAETARYLALWMAFDDIVRVADLKCRASRSARIRREVKAGDGDLVRVYDFFKPGIPEFAGMLPERWAQALLRWDTRRRNAGRKPLALALKIGTHGILGAIALRTLASLRGLRRGGSRYAREQAMIERWLTSVVEGSRANWELGHEIALCGRLIKGYGSTNERGKENLLHVMDHLAVAGEFAAPQARASAIRAARVAALADDAGRALDRALEEHGVAARPVKAHPVMWVRKPRGTAP